VNLSTHLASLGVLNSELGKNELNQCRQQIISYRNKSQDYKQCLIKNNNSEFSLPTNRVVQPLLKTFFCPIFYGDNSSYDPDADLCFCGKGSFLSDDKCVDASSICRKKYGTKSYSKNGNCLNTSNTSTLKPTASTPPPIKEEFSISTTLNLPSITPTPYTPTPTTTDTPKILTDEPLQKNPGLLKSTLNSFVSMIKKLLKL
jgi:hypothetical protein